jgi:hypothetical protein
MKMKLLFDVVVDGGKWWKWLLLLLFMGSRPLRR